MICQQCGAESPESAVFCMSCGMKFMQEEERPLVLPPPFTKERFRFFRMERRLLKKYGFQPDRTFMVFLNKGWGANYFMLDDTRKQLGIFGLVDKDLYLVNYQDLESFEILMNSEPVPTSLNEHPETIDNIEVLLHLRDADFPMVRMPLLLAKQSPASSSYRDMLNMVRTFARTLQYVVDFSSLS